MFTFGMLSATRIDKKCRNVAWIEMVLDAFGITR
jgi:hypothetical protein